MEKSEVINDLSEARNKALHSPLFEMVHKTWRHFDEEFTSPVSLKEEDIVRYITWCIENIKGGEEDPSVSCLDLRRSVVNLFREANYPSELTTLLPNVICAYVLACVDCAFLYSRRNDLFKLCSIAENSIKKEYKQGVSERKAIIKNRILQSGLTSALGEWCTEHLLNNVFMTAENAEWAGESGDTNPNNGNYIDPNYVTTMLKYCTDRAKCEIIVQILAGCDSSEALKTAILTIDEDGQMIDMYVMDSLLFCRDIIPMIKYETNENAIKQIIHRLNTQSNCKKHKK